MDKYLRERKRMPEEQRRKNSEALKGRKKDPQTRKAISRDRIFRVAYYRFPCYIEYTHEHQDDGFQLDCLYLGQEHSFMLVQPDYKSALGVAPSILQWLDATYAMCCPPEPPRPKKSSGKRASAQPSRGQNCED